MIYDNKVDVKKIYLLRLQKLITIKSKAIMDLVSHQKKLKLKLMKYSLSQELQVHTLIQNLRQKIIDNLPKGIYDSQDLEHQVLFRLTTFDPEKINDQLIIEIIKEQYLLIKYRLNTINKTLLSYLFRGLQGNHKDLNIQKRLTIKKIDNKYYACNDNYKFEIEFRKLEDNFLIDLFTNKLHYIHAPRSKGESFGLYFKGDSIPWAIETTESAMFAQKYKQEALLAHGIDPAKAIEITRLYILPGSPVNSISLIDRVVSQYYKGLGMEAMFTTTMPMYAKTKGATLAGGMNKVLLVKDLLQYFVPIRIDGKTVYQQVPESYILKNEITDFITTHPKFKTLYTVETFMLLGEPSLKPLPILNDKEKVIYVSRNTKSVEVEMKFFIQDIDSVLPKLQQNANFLKVEYILDTIYGEKESKKKIRHRVVNNFISRQIEVIYKSKISSENGIRTETEEILYQGDDDKSAIKAIKEQGDFEPENSYEKIRIVYSYKNLAKLFVDIYPYGAYLEIEGKRDCFKDILNFLSLTESDATTKNADECYLEWNSKMNLKELWHIRFGLTDKYEN